MLSTEQAAEIARRHGLGLPDVSALVSLADDAEEAEKLAQQFARSDADLEDILESIPGASI